MAKLLLEAHQLRKGYGDRTVLAIDRLHIYDGERIALIGENGAGKSTLLSILAGEMEPDEGSIRRYCPTALIRQSGETRTNGTAQLASELGAPEGRKGLSGGEMTRRRIAEALSREAPLLLADEPTTDLDAGGIERLTELLAGYRGAIVLVSHDRDLLDALCTRILHLEDGVITDHPGTWSEYREELRRRREFQRSEYERYQAERARLKAMAQQKAEWAASVQKAPKRMGNSEARLHTREYTNAQLRQSAAKKIVQNRMERLEKKERPRDLPDIRMSLGLDYPIEAKTALSVLCNRMNAGGRTLLENAQFVLPTGSRTALMGDNGTGKSTLLRTIRGERSDGIVFHGDVRLNPKVRLGWFDQDHAKTLSSEHSALENVLETSAQSVSMARTVLARMGLRGDDVFKRISVLSGGERAKVALAKLLLSDVNLLILDEPTNHLDLFTLEALEKLLAGYGGTLLFVSHDKAFVSSVATRVLTLSGQRLSCFEGTVMELRAQAARDRTVEARQMEISTIEMRMAALAARMSSPHKGDKPDKLNAEYRALANQLRVLKG